MIFGINTTYDISKLSQISITCNNFEISLVVFTPNITTNHAITYTNSHKITPHTPTTVIPKNKSNLHYKFIWKATYAPHEPKLKETATLKKRPALW